MCHDMLVRALKSIWSLSLCARKCVSVLVLYLCVCICVSLCACSVDVTGPSLIPSCVAAGF